MLDNTIAGYQQALEALPAEKTEAFARLAMNVLLARDRLAAELARTNPSSADLDTVVSLDERLKAAAPAVDAAVGRPTLVQWREADQPPAGAWWWRLDERAAAAEPRANPAWILAAALFLTVSISLSADLARRFLSVGPDSVGAFSIMVQALLTFLAGRSLTGAGQQSMESLLVRLNIHRRHTALATALFALMVMLLVLGLRLSLPAIARQYNNQAVRAQQSGQVTSAIMDYQRAISLRPVYAEAHYNLGTAYEDVLAYDLAIPSYQAALRLNAILYPAYNNLARALMLSRKDYAGALPLLDTALDLDIKLPEQQLADVRYSLLKNRAWAYLGLKYLTLAESDIQQALALRPEGAAAHCLNGQVLEAQNRMKDALPEWEACLRYANTDVVPVEASWLALARERLSEEMKK